MNTKEAIERIKARFDKWALDNEDMKAIQTLIPKLAESEDERIRKKLIRLVQDAINKTGTCYTEEEGKPLLAYLEKQKEEKPTEWSEEDKTIIDCAVEVVEKAGLPSLAASLKSLKSNWKPNEEQMKELLFAEKIIRNEGFDYTAAIIGDLYNELKQL